MELLRPIDTVLRLLREDKNFRTEFSKVAEPVSDKIYSYYNNPNCTCKGAIVEWINGNVEKTNEVLGKYKEAIQDIENDVKKGAEVLAKVAATPVNQAKNIETMFQNPKSKYGAIFTIDRSQAAYYALIKQAMTEGWMYRGCTVTPELENNKAVWKVFFY